MLIADTNEFHPLINGVDYASGRAADGSAYSVIIMRATYASSHVDNAYATSVAQARAGGLHVGHYGYVVQSEDAGVQGAFFAQTVMAHGGLVPGDAIWADVEEGGGDQAPRAEAFLAAAHAVLKDQSVDEGVYSGESFWNSHLGNLPSGLNRWIAAYGTGTPPPGNELWQFTDAQVVPGVEGACDCSIYKGTLAQYLTMVGANIVPPPPPPPHPIPTPTPVPPKPIPRPPAPRPPAFPLPAGWYYGPANGPKESVSGLYTPYGGPNGAPGLRMWQARMAARGWTIGVDGKYGSQTETVARAFQTEKHLGVDGEIGVNTWNAAWTSPVT